MAFLLDQKYTICYLLLSPMCTGHAALQHCMTTTCISKWCNHLASNLLYLLYLFDPQEDVSNYKYFSSRVGHLLLWCMPRSVCRIQWQGGELDRVRPVWCLVSLCIQSGAIPDEFYCEDCERSKFHQKSYFRFPLYPSICGNLRTSYKSCSLVLGLYFAFFHNHCCTHTIMQNCFAYALCVYLQTFTVMSLWLIVYSKQAWEIPSLIDFTRKMLLPLTVPTIHIQTLTNCGWV